MNTTQEDGHPGGTPEGNEQHRVPVTVGWDPFQTTRGTRTQRGEDDA